MTSLTSPVRFRMRPLAQGAKLAYIYSCCAELLNDVDPSGQYHLRRSAMVRGFRAKLRKQFYRHHVQVVLLSLPALNLLLHMVQRSAWARQQNGLVIGLKRLDFFFCAIFVCELALQARRVTFACSTFVDAPLHARASPYRPARRSPCKRESRASSSESMRPMRHCCPAVPHSPSIVLPERLACV